MRVCDNREKHRFEAEVDGHTAIVRYSVQPGILKLEHTEVPKELSGQGIGSEMVEKVLLEIELRGLKIIVECPFIKNYIEKHPEWKSLEAEEER